MKRTSFASFDCSIARSLELVGEWWTPLVLRSVFLGVTRFDDIQRDLGIARNVLADRLDALVEAGMLERRPYQRNPVRHEYLLTDKGRDFCPVLMALMAWGDRWTAGEQGPPARLRHDACGSLTTPVVSCSECGEPLTAEGVTALAGPGGSIGPGTRVSGALLAERSVA
jgi:DNA-binding HxlR family transcriptional regulator